MNYSIVLYAFPTCNTQCIYVCTCVYVCMYVVVFMYVHVCIYLSTCMYICMYDCMYVGMYVHTICTYMYIFMHDIHVLIIFPILKVHSVQKYQYNLS